MIRSVLKISLVVLQICYVTIIYDVTIPKDSFRSSVLSELSVWHTHFFFGAATPNRQLMLVTKILGFYTGSISRHTKSSTGISSSR